METAAEYLHALNDSHTTDPDEHIRIGIETLIQSNLDKYSKENVLEHFHKLKTRYSGDKDYDWMILEALIMRYIVD